MARSLTMPTEITDSSRFWFTAVALDGAAVILLVVLAATHASSYGTVGGGATANSALLESLALVAGVVLIVKMRAGIDWARTLLGALSLPVVAYLVLQIFGPLGHGMSTVNLLRVAIVSARALEAAAIVAAVVLMYRPAAKDYFAPAEQA